MTDPLDDLRRAYEELRPPRAPDAADGSDARTRQVVTWLRRAYDGLPVPASVPSARARAVWARRRAAGPRRWIAAAALLLAFAGALHLGVSSRRPLAVDGGGATVRAPAAPAPDAPHESVVEGATAPAPRDVDIARAAGPPVALVARAAAPLDGVIEVRSGPVRLLLVTATPELAR